MFGLRQQTLLNRIITLANVKAKSRKSMDRTAASDNQAAVEDHRRLVLIDAMGIIISRKYIAILNK